MQSAAINPSILTGTRGILRVMSPDAVNRAEQDQRRKAEELQNRVELISLAANIRKRWDAALKSKQMTIDERLLRCRRQRNGEYDPEVLQEITRFGGTNIFMLLTSVKCRAAAAWIRDVMLPPGEKPWALDPTPLPSLPTVDELKIANEVRLEAVTMMLQQGVETITPEQIRDRLQELTAKVRDEKYQQAKLATNRFELKVDDELQEGGFYKTLADFIDDLVTYPTAFICGPEVRRRKVMAWRQDRDGNWQPEIVHKLVREYRRVSPFDLFPAPSAKTLQEGYLFERVRLRRKDLIAMRGVPGFSDTAVQQVIRDYGTKGHKEWLSADRDRAELENRPQEDQDPDPPIDALQYWGSAQGAELIEWGMPQQKIRDPLAEYEINAWLVDRVVICARLNPHPLGHRPYYGTSYERVADSIWGKSPPELMRDVQRVCNGVARAIVNNAGVASGPQVEVNKSRMMPGQNTSAIWPWKIWETKDDKFGHGRPALTFYQPNMLTEALVRVYEYFFDQASEQAGIPAYIYGNQDVGGGGKTASGLSMLMNAASKALKAVIMHVDDDIIKPIIKEHWTHIMLYDEDELKCGDINVIARASEYLLMQEQYQLRRLEFMDKSNNPVDQAILGPKVRILVWKEIARSLKMPSVEQEVDKILKKLEEAEAVPMPVPAAPGVPGPVPPGPVQPEREGANPRQAAIIRPNRNTGPAGYPPGEQMRMAA